MVRSLVHSWQSIGGDARLGLLVKRGYRMEPGRLASALDDYEPPLHFDPVLRVETDGGLPLLLHESDLLAFDRPLTDVLVMGQAHSTRGTVTELETGIEVASARKRVRILGDRVVRLGAAGSLETTAPAGFRTMPLEWTRAYGGRDRYAERRHRTGRSVRAEQPELLGIYAYPRNVVGRGFALDLDRERLAGAPLPNLEDPDDPVTPERLLARDDLDWIDRPIAASYGPLDLVTFPRSMFGLLRPDWAPPSQTIAELRLGALAPSDLEDPSWEQPSDPRICNAAAAGLAVCRLEGAERVSLWNLHPSYEMLELWLPAERPRVRIEPPGAGVREPPAVLQELLLEPDADRMTLTWTASLPVAAVYPQAMCREMRHEVRWDR